MNTPLRTGTEMMRGPLEGRGKVLAWEYGANRHVEQYRVAHAGLPGAPVRE